MYEPHGLLQLAAPPAPTAIAILAPTEMGPNRALDGNAEPVDSS